MSKSRPRICLTPKCRNEAKRRGACDACYQAMRRLIDSGDETDATLVEKKLLLEPFQPRSTLRKALDK